MRLPHYKMYLRNVFKFRAQDREFAGKVNKFTRNGPRSRCDGFKVTQHSHKFKLPVT